MAFKTLAHLSSSPVWVYPPSITCSMTARRAKVPAVAWTPAALSGSRYAVGGYRNVPKYIIEP